MNYELLYLQRHYAESMIALNDELIKCEPHNLTLIRQRQQWARLAMLLHARIERLERNYDQG